MTNQPEWMSDPEIENIPIEKLRFLEEMFSQGVGKSQKDLLKIYPALLLKAKHQNITFTPQEVNAAITAIRRHSSEQEQTTIDELIQKVNRMK